MFSILKCWITGGLNSEYKCIYTNVYILYCDQFCNYHCSTAGIDFFITENAISFAGGSPAGTVQCFTVTILTDEEIEGDEAFSLLLLSDQADIEPGSGTLEVIITDGMWNIELLYIGSYLHAIFLVIKSLLHHNQLQSL